MTEKTKQIKKSWTKEEQLRVAEFLLALLNREGLSADKFVEKYHLRFEKEYIKSKKPAQKREENAISRDKIYRWIDNGVSKEGIGLISKVFDVESKYLVNPKIKIDWILDYVEAKIGEDDFLSKIEKVESELEKERQQSEELINRENELNLTKKQLIKKEEDLERQKKLYEEELKSEKEEKRKEDFRKRKEEIHKLEYDLKLEKQKLWVIEQDHHREVTQRNALLKIEQDRLKDEKREIELLKQELEKKENGIRNNRNYKLRWITIFSCVLIIVIGLGAFSFLKIKVSKQKSELTYSFNQKLVSHEFKNNAELVSEANYVINELRKLKGTNENYDPLILNLVDEGKAYLFDRTQETYIPLTSLNLDNSKIVDRTLRQVNFSNSTFRNSNLDKSDLSGSVFSGSDFSKASLVETNLDHCDLQNTVYDKTKLNVAIMSYTNLMNAKFDDSDLYRADLQDSNLQNVEFHNTKLKSVNWTRSNPDNAIFDGSNGVLPYWINAGLNDQGIFTKNKLFESIRSGSTNLIGANLYDFEFVSLPNMKGLQLSGADLSKTRYGNDLSKTKNEDELSKDILDGITFKNVSNLPIWVSRGLEEKAGIYRQDILIDHIINAGFRNLQHTRLVRANLSNMDLEGINFSGANLKYVNFFNSNLKNANFSDAKIDFCTFTNADLNSVKFQNSIIQDSLFASAILKEAVFTNVKLIHFSRKIDFSNSNLTGAKLNPEDFKNTVLLFAKSDNRRLAEMIANEYKRRDFKKAFNVLVEPSGGEYTNGVSVKLSAQNQSTIVYYTLDGSTPTPRKATEYIQGKEIYIDKSCTLKAVAYRGGRILHSDVLIEHYDIMKK